MTVIREAFLRVYHCSEGLSGLEISTKILDTVKTLGLGMENGCGQGYDGAGNMAGKCNEAVTRMQQQHSKALYANCKSHLLNISNGH